MAIFEIAYRGKIEIEAWDFEDAAEKFFEKYGTSVYPYSFFNCETGAGKDVIEISEMDGLPVFEDSPELIPDIFEK
jgi:hypothetical protein